MIIELFICLHIKFTCLVYKTNFGSYNTLCHNSLDTELVYERHNEAQASLILKRFFDDPEVHCTKVTSDKQINNAGR